MSDDPAKPRFFMILALRWSGVALVLLGMMVQAGRTALPQPLGYALLVVGLACAMIFPTLLARRWKTPKE